MKSFNKTYIESVRPFSLLTSPSTNVSDKYSFIPTTQIMNDLGQEGWSKFMTISKELQDWSRNVYKTYVEI